MPERRAVRDFSVTVDPWPVVERWAGEQGFRATEQDENRRLYRKGSGFWAGSRRVELQREGDKLHLEAWVYAPLLTRILSAFILPSEITIESGGMKAVLPRKLGREEVNELLRQFVQSPIP